MPVRKVGQAGKSSGRRPLVQESGGIGVYKWRISVRSMCESLSPVG